MTDITIPKVGLYSQSWSVSGVNMTGDYVSLKGFVNPGAGSPYIFDWNTSGGELTLTGSTVSGARIDVSVNTGSIASQTILGYWLERINHLNGRSYFYDNGRADVVFGATQSSLITTYGPAPSTSTLTFTQVAGTSFTGTEPNTGRSYTHTAAIVAGTISMDGVVLSNTEYTLSTTTINNDTITININLFNNSYVVFGVSG